MDRTICITTTPWGSKRRKSANRKLILHHVLLSGTTPLFWLVLARTTATATLTTMMTTTHKRRVFGSGPVFGWISHTSIVASLSPLFPYWLFCGQWRWRFLFHRPPPLRQSPLSSLFELVDIQSTFPSRLMNWRSIFTLQNYDFLVPLPLLLWKKLQWIFYWYICGW